MNVMNFLEAKDWIAEGAPVIYDQEESKFVRGDWKERIHRFFSSDYNKKQVERVVEVVRETLISNESAIDPSVRELWEVCVQKYQSEKHLRHIVRVADRAICKDREDLDFREKGNLSALQKWTRYGHDPEIFRKFPEFAQFMFDSNLISQMKVTRDSLKYDDGEPSLLVEGEWMKWDQVLENYTFKMSKRYGEVFILRKSDSEVFTYLDNGKGLQLHHPYQTKKLTPISTVSDQELQELQEKAALFERNDEMETAPERPFVLQIVSSYVKGPDTNFHDLVVKRKHPYLRVIIGKDNPELGTKKGEVYEVGYGWKRRPLVPFMLATGQFRSPDVWEYMPCEERIVTNIPISQEEAHNVFAFTQKFHNESVNLGHEIGFHLGRQNCSVYVREAAKKAGIELPTEIKVTSFIAKVSPEWVKAAGRGIHLAAKQVKTCAYKAVQILPDWFKNPMIAGYREVARVAKKVSQLVIAFLFNPFRILLGDGMGKKARGFEEDKEVKPAMQKLRSYFTIPTINLPGILQEWQRQQLSTVIHKQPRQFAI